MTKPKGPEGPIGNNSIIFDNQGVIIQSDLPNFLKGNTIWDYIPLRYHYQLQVIIENLPQIKRQPITFDFETLFKGRYYPRRGRVWYAFDAGGTGKPAYPCVIEDRPKETNIIEYANLPPQAGNYFTVARNGLILHCKYPERTIAGDPVGLNIFDILLPQYQEQVKATMVVVLHKRIELPIEYGIKVGDQVLYETGTIKSVAGNAVFHVGRIYHDIEKN